MFFHQGAELTTEPGGGESVLGHRVMVGAFEIDGPAGVCSDLAVGKRSQRNMEVTVDRADGFGGIGHQIAVENTEIAIGSSAGIPLFEMTKPGGSEFGILAGLSPVFEDGGVDPFPDGVKDADVGGDRFGRVAQNGNDAGVGELLTEGKNGAGELGAFGEKDLIWPIQVEMPLQTGAIVMHEPPPLCGRQVVGKAGPPKGSDEGEKQVDGFGDEGIYKKTIILLRLCEAHLVHPVPPTEAVAFNPRGNIEQEMRFFLAGIGDGVNQLLERNTGENCLIHQDRGESMPVFCEKFLQETRPTAGRGNYEDRSENLLPSESWVKNVIESPANGHDDPKQAEEIHEKTDNHPPPKLEWFSEIGEIKSFGYEAEIKVHDREELFVVEKRPNSMQTLVGVIRINEQ